MTLTVKKGKNSGKRYQIGVSQVERSQAKRGVNVNHTMIYRWVQRYVPEMDKWFYAGTGVTQ